jgi:DNA-binding response OmpR family regulator
MPKLLLVEDNELNYDMLSRRLMKRGFEVEIVTNGREGYEAASSRRFDLVLLDMSLPEMDGWTVARQLRMQPETASLPVIALTAHVMTEDRARALEAGCDDYATKPVDIEALVAKIRTLLAKTAPAGI